MDKNQDNNLLNTSEVANITPVSMPDHLVHTFESVFAGTPLNNWNQIMEFEVDEEGWDTIEQIIKNGPNPYLEILKTTYSKKSLKNNTGYKIQMQNIIKRRFPSLLNSLCKDGMVLQDDASLGIKIVATKEKRGNSNYYKIFSNRRVQCEEIFGKEVYNRKNLEHFLLGSVGHDVFGINSLINALSKQKRFINAKWDYLLFSLTSEVSKYNIEKDTSGQFPNLVSLAQKYKRIVPGVFSIHGEETPTNGQILPHNSKLFFGVNDSLILPPELTKSFLDMYEDIISKMPKKTLPDNNTPKIDSSSQEEDFEI